MFNFGQWPVADSILLSLERNLLDNSGYVEINRNELIYKLVMNKYLP